MEQGAVERERRAFVYWMRTGRILPDDAVHAEWKFNPWHDPHNGRFTSRSGSDRRPGDDGGHFIAHRFNGPRDSFNHFAQNARFNRGGYRAMEDDWARAKRAGKSVFVRIVPSYPGTSLRPSSIRVKWTVDGHTRETTFNN